MTISRDTFDPTKNYKKVVIHQDRDGLDSEMTELQDIINADRRRIADLVLQQGAIISGLGVVVAGNVLVVESGQVYLEGRVESVPGATLTYDPAGTPP